MKNRIVFFICLLVLCLSGVCNAQKSPLVISPDMQYDYARSLMEEEDWETAMVELKRFSHFFPESEHHDAVQFSIAQCLYHLKRHMGAAKSFNRIILENRWDEWTIQAYFYQSQSFVNLGNTGYAKIVLQNLLKLADTTEIRDKALFRLAGIYLKDAGELKAGALSRARESLEQISKEGRQRYPVDALQELVNQAELLPRKSPAAAGALALIPGGGFLYCERYKDAAVAFLLNIGLMAAAYEAWDDGNEPLGAVIGFVESGFYMGGIYGSISSAHKHNRARLEKLLGPHITLSPRLDPEKKGVGLSLEYKF